MKQEQNFPVFKLRASSGGVLMANSKEKSNKEKFEDAKNALEKLQAQYNNFVNKECKSAQDILNTKIPETKKLIAYLAENLDEKPILAKTVSEYVYSWLKEHIYSVRKEIKSKYLSKGNQVENIAIDKVIEWLDLPFAVKNEQFFEDEFFCGTPDLIINDTVYDTKCSWDCFSFPLFENDIPNEDYFYQLQIYMHLTGLKKAILVYCLINTPENIQNESYNYDNLEKKFRIKKYEFNYDKNVIEELKKRILTVREYIKTLEL